jgi:hypothetical protein
MESQELREGDNLQQKKVKANTRNPFGFFGEWDYNITTDQEAPLLYSRLAIYCFTVLCSVFFGGVLMFLNLRKLKNKRGQVVVVIYTVLYGAITFPVLIQFDMRISLLNIVNILGSIPFYYIFWVKYVGKTTKYRTESVLIPSVICSVIWVLFIILTFCM